MVSSLDHLLLSRFSSWTKLNVGDVFLPATLNTLRGRPPDRSLARVDCFSPQDLSLIRPMPIRRARTDKNINIIPNLVK